MPTTVTLCLVVLAAVSSVLALAYCQAPLPVYYPAPAGMKLVHASIIVRHGDRAPTTVFPFLTDPRPTWECEVTTAGQMYPTEFTGEAMVEKAIYIDNTSLFGQYFWSGNCTAGQLTLRGAQQHVAMGTALRSIYVDQFALISGDYSPSDIYIRADDCWRTQTSAQANMLGFYPNRGNVVIPIHTLPDSVETINANPTFCPNAFVVTYNRSQTPEWAEIVEPAQAVLAKLANVTGYTDYWLGSFWDDVAARFCHNISFPCNPVSGECITESDWQAMVENVDTQYNWLQSGDYNLKLNVGPFLLDLFNYFRGFLAGEPAFSAPYAFWSTHDSTVSFVLNAFNFTPSGWPPYASSVQVELFKDATSAYWMRWIYNGELLPPPLYCEADSVEFACPLDSVVEYMKYFWEIDLTTDCGFTGVVPTAVQRMMRRK